MYIYSGKIETACSLLNAWKINAARRYMVNIEILPSLSEILYCMLLYEGNIKEDVHVSSVLLAYFHVAERGASEVDETIIAQTFSI